MAMAAVPPTAGSAGKVIGSYKLVARLGKGGMGSVFRATHVDTGDVVAFKVLMPSDAKNEQLVKRFQRESKIALGLRHENIVGGIDAGTVGNLCYLAMEFVDGEPLSDLLRREKRLSTEHAVRIMSAMARALGHAHAQGLIHRDVKPENILMGRDGSIKLCDLGLAREIDDTAFTMMGAALGTPKYMSPEQVAGLKTIDFRTDVYSLGATAYHMVAGRTPFQAKSNIDMMAAQVSGKFHPLRDVAPDVDEHLAQVIEKCMRKDPNERYQSMEELLADLQSTGGAKKRQSPAPRKQERTEKKRSRPAPKKSSGGLLAVIFLVVIGVIAAGVWAALWGPLKDTAAPLFDKDR